MSGGSLEREGPRDAQCGHCKRFYSLRGIGGHEDNCPAAALVEQGYTVIPPNASDEEGVEGIDEEDVETPAPDAVEGSNPSPHPTPAMTDGGEAMEVPTFTESVERSTTADEDDVEDDRAVDVERALEDVDDEDETEDCPHCGTDSDMTRDELARGKTYRCSECGKTFVWRPAA